MCQSDFDIEDGNWRFAVGLTRYARRIIGLSRRAGRIGAHPVAYVTKMPSKKLFWSVRKLSAANRSHGHKTEDEGK